MGGWLFTQRQARRETRRNMRIGFLLDAYRRLDRATNRPLTDTTAQDIEAAVSDIMLLGTPGQAKLADHFGRAFAADGTAESTPLLIDLRASLRKEASLEELPPNYMALRITTNGDSISESARIWHETSQATRQAANTELASHGTGVPEPPATSPSAIVAESYQQVERALRDLLANATDENLSALNLAQLANRALQLKLIDPHLADTLDGLGIMRMLAAMEQDRLDHSKATEFSDLATAALYLIDIASRRT